jgi:hypothetical protein
MGACLAGELGLLHQLDGDEGWHGLQYQMISKFLPESVILLQWKNKNS